MLGPRSRMLQRCFTSLKVNNCLRTLQPTSFALQIRLLSSDKPPTCPPLSKHNFLNLGSCLTQGVRLSGHSSREPSRNVSTGNDPQRDARLNRIYTLPNLLCAFRIGVTPVIGCQIVAGQFEWALALCALSSVTDFLDGWIARRYNEETKLGAVLDPLADKLLVATLTFTLAYVQLIPLFLAGLILLRDSLIITGGLWMRYRSLPPPLTFARFFDMDTFKSERFAPTFISKLNTGLQLSLVLVTLASPIMTGFFESYSWFLPSLQVSTGVTTLWSGLNYLTRLK